MKTIKELKTFLNKIDSGQPMPVIEMIEYHNYFLRTNLDGCSDHRTHKILICNLRNYVVMNDTEEIILKKEPKEILARKISKEILPKSENVKGIVTKNPTKKKK